MLDPYLGYDALYGAARAKGWEGWGGNARINKVVDLIPRLMAHDSAPAQGRLLELGCGEGSLSRAFANLGYEVTGIDISNTAIEWAKEKSINTPNPITFLRADLTNQHLVLPDQYDMVVDGNCLHCIIGQDRAVFLHNVYRFLKPQGVFFVSSLCSKTEEIQLIENSDRMYRHVPSIQTLGRELNHAGFEVIHTLVSERAHYNHVNMHAIPLHC